MHSESRTHLWQSNFIVVEVLGGTHYTVVSEDARRLRLTNCLILMRKLATFDHRTNLESKRELVVCNSNTV